MRDGQGDGLEVTFAVVSTEEFGGRRYFMPSGAVDMTIKLFNFPPFPELIGSSISVFSPKTPEGLHRVCYIDVGAMSLIPREHSVKACFSEWIPGISKQSVGLEAMWLDVGDSFTITIPQKNGIACPAHFERFLKVKYFTAIENKRFLSRKKFEKRMQRMRKTSYTGEDVLRYFSFPEILFFP